MTYPEVEQAVALYKQGYTCAQSILASFGRRFGLRQDLAFRIGEPFGAGTGCSNDMCGSVIGAIMVLGLQFGASRPDDNSARAYTYQRVHELIRRFKDIRGSIQCTDLLGYDLSDPLQFQTALEKQLFTQLCPGLVRDAALVLVAMLETPAPPGKNSA